MHQLRRGLPLNRGIDSNHWVDGLNELQIRDVTTSPKTKIVAQLRAIGRRRSRDGGGHRRRCATYRFPSVPIGWAPLKYLLDVGFTRDVWAHRIDIHAAIGRPMHLTADHDGRLVADIVGEWAALHGQPFELVLDGSAGGKFTQGSTRNPSRSTPSTSSAPSPVASPAPVS